MDKQAVEEIICNKELSSIYRQEIADFGKCIQAECYIHLTNGIFVFTIYPNFKNYYVSECIYC